MGAQIAHAIGVAGQVRIAAPFALLAAPFALVCQPALRILGRDRANLADIAALDDLAGVLGRHMPHVGIGHHEQQPLLGRQRLQLARLLAGHAKGFVAADVNPSLKKRLARAVMRVVRRYDDDKVDPVGAGAFGLGHLFIVRVAAILSHVELFCGLQGFFHAAGKAACNKRSHAVQIDRPAVRVSNKRTGPAADHAVSKLSHFSIHSLFALFVMPPNRRRQQEYP